MPYKVVHHYINSVGQVQTEETIYATYEEADEIKKLIEKAYDCAYIVLQIEYIDIDEI
jgi:hypothetical protein